LRASAVPVSGTVAVTGTQTDSLTNTELRATAVPVSGTVAVTGTQADSLTDTELRATALPVSGTVTVSNDPATISLTPSTSSLTSAAALTISPSAGTEALRLWWVSVIPDPDNADTGYATVAVGSTEVYRSPALAHRQRFDGAAGEDIVVAIVGAGTFLATVHYLEFTP
jgi:hypothetical protein